MVKRRRYQLCRQDFRTTSLSYQDERARAVHAAYLCSALHGGEPWRIGLHPWQDSDYDYKATRQI